MFTLSLIVHIYLIAAMDLNSARISFTGIKNKDVKQLYYTNTNVLMREKDDTEKAVDIFAYRFGHSKSKST